MYSHRVSVALCTVLVLLLSVDLVQLQETTEDALSVETTTQYVAVPINATYLSSVKYYLKDESFDDVAAIIIANNASLYNISLPDLLQVTDIENKNFSDISKVLDGFDLASQEVFNFENIEAAFGELNISLLTLYSRIRVGFIPDASTNIPLLQEQLGINGAEFDSTILYGNDSSLFKILKESNFSSENIKKAFGIINKTPSDLYTFVKPYVFEKVKDYPLERLLEVSKEQGIEQNHLKDLLKALNVTPDKYQAVPALKNALEDFEAMINRVEILATGISQESLVTVNSVAVKLRNLREIADLFVEPQDNSNTTFRVNTTKIDSFDDSCLYGPIVLSPEGYRSPIDIEVEANDSTHHLSDCTYVTVINNTFVEESIPTVHNNKLTIIADFPNVTIFKIGSPLFCSGKLYGVAEELNGNQIGFRPFYCDPDATDSTTIFAESAAVSCTRSYFLLTVVLGLLSLFKLIR